MSTQDINRLLQQARDQGDTDFQDGESDARAAQDLRASTYSSSDPARGPTASANAEDLPRLADPLPLAMSTGRRSRMPPIAVPSKSPSPVPPPAFWYRGMSGPEVELYQRLFPNIAEQGEGTPKQLLAWKRHGTWQSLNLSYKWTNDLITRFNYYFARSKNITLDSMLYAEWILNVAFGVSHVHQPSP